MSGAVYPERMDLWGLNHSEKAGAVNWSLPAFCKTPGMMYRLARRLAMGKSRICLDFLAYISSVNVPNSCDCRNGWRRPGGTLSGSETVRLLCFSGGPVSRGVL